jgi:hypothetical protein
MSAILLNSWTTPCDQNRHLFLKKLLLSLYLDLKVNVKYLLYICKHVSYWLLIGFSKIFITT